MQKVRMFDCETALRSSFTTEETRRESYEKVNKEKMHLLILEQLSHFDMTAREIATSLYQQGKVLEPTRQQVQPRLTELVQDGKVEVVGKRMDDLTGKSVAIYRLVVKDEERDYQGSEESSCGGISQK